MIKQLSQPTTAVAVICPSRPHISLPDIEIGEELGRGGMGIVFKGRQTYIDRPVAIKVLRQHSSETVTFVPRFQREAKILAQLQHPNIVACHQAGVSDQGDCYLVMEYIDGMDLRDAITDQGPLPEKALLRLGHEMASALQHANEHNIIHRDVKPDNILLQPLSDGEDQWPWRAKLADLGLARPQQTALGDQNITAAGMVVGTPSTMAPEQIDQPDTVDFRADMYGLGCVLFQAATGEAAFSASSFSKLIQAKTTGPVPDPSIARPDLSPATCDIIRTMLARDPDDRYASYEVLIQKISQLRMAQPPRIGPPGLKHLLRLA